MYVTYWNIFPLHGSTLIFCWCFYLEFGWLTTILLHSFICVIHWRLISTLDVLLVYIFCCRLWYIEHSEGILICSGRVSVPLLLSLRYSCPLCLLQRWPNYFTSSLFHFFFSTSCSRLHSVSFRGFLLLPLYVIGYYGLILIDCLSFVVFLE